MNQATTFSLPKSLVRLLEAVQRKRRDPTRSDTARILLLQALGSMSYLSASEKKALGIRTNQEAHPKIKAFGDKTEGWIGKNIRVTVDSDGKRRIDPLTRDESRRRAKK